MKTKVIATTKPTSTTNMSECVDLKYLFSTSANGTKWGFWFSDREQAEASKNSILEAYPDATVDIKPSEAPAAKPKKRGKKNAARSKAKVSDSSESVSQSRSMMPTTQNILRRF